MNADSLPDLRLRLTVEADLPTLFRFQADPAYSFMAAFMAKDYLDEGAYIAKYLRLLADPSIHQQTILLDSAIIGNVAKYMMEDEPQVTYGIDRAHWGKGLATAALRLFLSIEPARPIWGRVAFDNLGSQKVLLRCGFEKVGTDSFFANARGAEIEELIYKLG